MKDASLGLPATATRLTDGVALHRGIRPSGVGIGWHTHDYHSITVLLSSPGVSQWCCGDEKRRSVRPVRGDVFFCPAYVPLSVQSEKAFESVLLCLSPKFLFQVCDRIGENRALELAPAVMRKDSFIQQVVTSLVEETGQNLGAGRELFASSLATALGVHLNREYVGPSVSHNPVACLSDDELVKLNRHIDRNLDTPLTLDDLASVIGRSRFHFARLFKASTGETPHQYVVQRRVKRARELLMMGRTIVEVAAEVGFASQSHLHAHIRRAFGCTPGQLLGRPSSNA